MAGPIEGIKMGRRWLISTKRDSSHRWRGAPCRLGRAVAGRIALHLRVHLSQCGAGVCPRGHAAAEAGGCICQLSTCHMHRRLCEELPPAQQAAQQHLSLLCSAIIFTEIPWTTVQHNTLHDVVGLRKGCSLTFKLDASLVIMTS